MASNALTTANVSYKPPAVCKKPPYPPPVVPPPREKIKFLCWSGYIRRIPPWEADEQLECELKWDPENGQYDGRWPGYDDWLGFRAIIIPEPTLPKYAINLSWRVHPDAWQINFYWSLLEYEKRPYISPRLRQKEEFNAHLVWIKTYEIPS